MPQIDDIVILKEATGMHDTVTITVLDNGDLKIETGSFSPAVHTQADKFLQKTVEVVGGTVQMQKKMHNRHRSHIHQKHHVHNH